jgi:hypothetical protein
MSLCEVQLGSDLTAMILTPGVVVLLAVLQPTLAAFGVVSTGSAFRVDTGGGLVFDVNKYDASRIHI